MSTSLTGLASLLGLMAAQCLITSLSSMVSNSRSTDVAFGKSNGQKVGSYVNVTGLIVNDCKVKCDHLFQSRQRRMRCWVVLSLSRFATLQPHDSRYLRFSTAPIVMSFSCPLAISLFA